VLAGGPAVFRLFGGGLWKKECSFLKKRTKKLLDFDGRDPATVHANDQKSFASFLQKRRPFFTSRDVRRLA
jgi:hypothetical protein